MTNKCCPTRVTPDPFQRHSQHLPHTLGPGICPTSLPTRWAIKPPSKLYWCDDRDNGRCLLSTQSIYAPGAGNTHQVLAILVTEICQVPGSSSLPMLTAWDTGGSHMPATHRDVQSTHVDSMGWDVRGPSMPVGHRDVRGLLRYCLLQQGTPRQVISLWSAFLRLSTGTAKYIQERNCRGCNRRIDSSLE